MATSILDLQKEFYGDRGGPPMLPHGDDPKAILPPRKRRKLSHPRPKLRLPVDPKKQALEPKPPFPASHLPDGFPPHLAFRALAAYSLIRTMSTDLRLSPFTPNVFLRSLHLPFPNRLLGDVHVAILRILLGSLHMGYHWGGNKGAAVAAPSLSVTKKRRVDGVKWPLRAGDNLECMDRLTWPLFYDDYCHLTADLLFASLRNATNSVDLKNLDISSMTTTDSHPLVDYGRDYEGDEEDSRYGSSNEPTPASLFAPTPIELIEYIPPSDDEFVDEEDDDEDYESPSKQRGRKGRLQTEELSKTVDPKVKGTRTKTKASDKTPKAKAGPKQKPAKAKKAPKVKGPPRPRGRPPKRPRTEETQQVTGASKRPPNSHNFSPGANHLKRPRAGAGGAPFQHFPTPRHAHAANVKSATANGFSAPVGGYYTAHVTKPLGRPQIVPPPYSPGNTPGAVRFAPNEQQKFGAETTGYMGKQQYTSYDPRYGNRTTIAPMRGSHGYVTSSLVSNGSAAAGMVPSPAQRLSHVPFRGGNAQHRNMSWKAPWKKTTFAGSNKSPAWTVPRPFRGSAPFGPRSNGAHSGASAVVARYTNKKVLPTDALPTNNLFAGALGKVVAASDLLMKNTSTQDAESRAADTQSSVARKQANTDNGSSENNVSKGHCASLPLEPARDATSPGERGGASDSVELTDAALPSSGSPERGKQTGETHPKAVVFGRSGANDVEKCEVGKEHNTGAQTSDKCSSNPAGPVPDANKESTAEQQLDFPRENGLRPLNNAMGEASTVNQSVSSSLPGTDPPVHLRENTSGTDGLAESAVAADLRKQEGGVTGTTIKINPTSEMSSSSRAVFSGNGTTHSPKAGTDSAHSRGNTSGDDGLAVASVAADLRTHERGETRPTCKMNAVTEVGSSSTTVVSGDGTTQNLQRNSAVESLQGKSRTTFEAANKGNTAGSSSVGPCAPNTVPQITSSVEASLPGKSTSAYKHRPDSGGLLALPTGCAIADLTGSKEAPQSGGSQNPSVSSETLARSKTAGPDNESGESKQSSTKEDRVVKGCPPVNERQNAALSNDLMCDKPSTDAVGEGRNRLYHLDPSLPSPQPAKPPLASVLTTSESDRSVKFVLSNSAVPNEKAEPSDPSMKILSSETATSKEKSVLADSSEKIVSAETAAPKEKPEPSISDIIKAFVKGEHTGAQFGKPGEVFSTGIKEVEEKKNENGSDSDSWPQFIPLKRMRSGIPYHRLSLDEKLHILEFLLDELLSLDVIADTFNTRHSETSAIGTPFGALPSPDDLQAIENSDECEVCGEAGDLLCCDGCPASYHGGCLDFPKNSSLPDGRWLCPECRLDDPAKFGSLGGGRKGHVEWFTPYDVKVSSGICNSVEGPADCADGQQEINAGMSRDEYLVVHGFVFHRDRERSGGVEDSQVPLKGSALRSRLGTSPVVLNNQELRTHFTAWGSKLSTCWPLSQVPCDLFHNNPAVPTIDKKYFSALERYDPSFYKNHYRLAPLPPPMRKVTEAQLLENQRSCGVPNTHKLSLLLSKEMHNDGALVRSLRNEATLFDPYGVIRSYLLDLEIRLRKACLLDEFWGTKNKADEKDVWSRNVKKCLSVPRLAKLLLTLTDAAHTRAFVVSWYQTASTRLQESWASKEADESTEAYFVLALDSTARGESRRRHWERSEMSQIPSLLASEMTSLGEWIGGAQNVGDSPQRSKRKQMKAGFKQPASPSTPGGTETGDGFELDHQVTSDISTKQPPRTPQSQDGEIVEALHGEKVTETPTTMAKVSERKMLVSDEKKQSGETKTEKLASDKKPPEEIKTAGKCDKNGIASHDDKASENQKGASKTEKTLVSNKKSQSEVNKAAKQGKKGLAPHKDKTGGASKVKGSSRVTEPKEGKVAKGAETGNSKGPRRRKARRSGRTQTKRGPSEEEVAQLLSNRADAATLIDTLRRNKLAEMLKGSDVPFFNETHWASAGRQLFDPAGYLSPSTARHMGRKAGGIVAPSVAYSSQYEVGQVAHYHVWRKRVARCSSFEELLLLIRVLESVVDSITLAKCTSLAQRSSTSKALIHSSQRDIQTGLDYHLIVRGGGQIGEWVSARDVELNPFIMARAKKRNKHVKALNERVAAKAAKAKALAAKAAAEKAAAAKAELAKKKALAAQAAALAKAEAAKRKALAVKAAAEKAEKAAAAKAEAAKARAAAKAKEVEAAKARAAAKAKEAEAREAAKAKEARARAAERAKEVEAARARAAARVRETAAAKERARAAARARLSTDPLSSTLQIGTGAQRSAETNNALTVESGNISSSTSATALQTTFAKVPAHLYQKTDERKKPPGAARSPDNLAVNSYAPASGSSHLERLLLNHKTEMKNLIKQFGQASVPERQKDALRLTSGVRLKVLKNSIGIKYNEEDILRALTKVELEAYREASEENTSMASATEMSEHDHMDSAPSAGLSIAATKPSALTRNPAAELHALSSSSVHNAVHEAPSSKARGKYTSSPHSTSASNEPHRPVDAGGANTAAVFPGERQSRAGLQPTWTDKERDTSTQPGQFCTVATDTSLPTLGSTYREAHVLHDTSRRTEHSNVSQSRAPSSSAAESSDLYHRDVVGRSSSPSASDSMSAQPRGPFPSSSPITRQNPDTAVQRTASSKTSRLMSNPVGSSTASASLESAGGASATEAQKHQLYGSALTNQFNQSDLSSVIENQARLSLSLGQLSAGGNNASLFADGSTGASGLGSQLPSNHDSANYLHLLQGHQLGELLGQIAAPNMQQQQRPVSNLGYASASTDPYQQASVSGGLSYDPSAYAPNPAVANWPELNIQNGAAQQYAGQSYGSQAGSHLNQPTGNPPANTSRMAASVYESNPPPAQAQQLGAADLATLFANRRGNNPHHQSQWFPW